MERRKRIAAVLLAAGVLVACGCDDDEPEVTAPTEGASAETTTTVATSTTARSTTETLPATTLPAPGPVLVQSTLYPYGLRLLAEEILRPFQPAAVA